VTVVVTGAGGFVGAAVAAARDDVVALQHGVGYAFAGASARLDLTRPAHVERLIGDLGRVTAVVHCAAVTPFNRPGEFADAPNERMTAGVIRLCAALGAVRLVFASGWVVYAVDTVPVAEDARCAPATPYGAGKLRAERALRAGLPDTQVVNARLATVYGRGQRSPGLIPNLVGAGLSGGRLRVAAPDTRRDYLHIADAAAALARLVDLELDGHLDVNLGSGTSVAVGDVAELIAEAFAGELAVELDPAAAGTGPFDNRLDVTLARRLGVLGAPRELVVGLRDYVAWRAEAERRRAR
jgi:nucleoside-diphosphate-sugar epimerase